MEGYNGHARPLDRQIQACGYRLFNVNNLKLARYQEIFPAPAKTDAIVTKSAKINLLENSGGMFGVPVLAGILLPAPGLVTARLRFPVVCPIEQRIRHRLGLRCFGMVDQADHDQPAARPVEYVARDGLDAIQQSGLDMGLAGDGMIV